MLPEITLRQLDVFIIICRERSYSNAAIELRSTRANIRRIVGQLEEAVGAVLFEEKEDLSLHPTLFAQGMLAKLQPLSRALRRLGEGVNTLHTGGRILRFAAAGELFRGGLFTKVLGRLELSELFRPCFLKIETSRFRTALLNAECDAYFGIGLGPSERLEMIDLGSVPWKVLRHPGCHDPLPAAPSMLCGGGWRIGAIKEEPSAHDVLEAWRKKGASGGGAVAEAEWRACLDAPERIPHGHLIFVPDMAEMREDAEWPGYRFTIVMRSNHPYVELKPLLMAAAREGGRGH